LSCLPPTRPCPSCELSGRQSTPRPRLFFLLPRRPPPSTLFPYTTLFRSRRHQRILDAADNPVHADRPFLRLQGRRGICRAGQPPDRKSTRLNSSHVKISYAVFCLKKKRKSTRRHPRGRPRAPQPATTTAS